MACLLAGRGTVYAQKREKLQIRNSELEESRAHEAKNFRGLLIYVSLFICNFTRIDM